MSDPIVILGGTREGREIDPGYELEVAFNEALGDRIREDDEMACQAWCALANTLWKSPAGETWSYSFRAAGDAVAAIRNETGHMPYMRWYCCGREQTVTAEISEAMAKLGWAWKTDE
jgi:hypothetical protein